MLNKIGVEMIVFQPKDYERITVLGHILHYEELFCDLRDEDALAEISELRSGWDCKNSRDAEYLSSVFKRFLTEVLPKQSNWGNNEQDYDTALASDDFTLKGLLALSGKHRDVLYKENSETLNWLIARSILNEKKRNEVTDSSLLMLDKMLHDGGQSARYVVAEFGHKPHLDILIKDSLPHIRKLVAAHGHTDHLDILMHDEDVMVRRQVALVGGLKYLAVLCKDEDSAVRLAIANRGECAEVLATDESWYVRKAIALRSKKSFVKSSKLACDPIAAVRCEVASRGVQLDTLLTDEDEYVRADVAKQGRIEDLEVLINDPSRIVRLAVLKQGYGLNQLANDVDAEVRECATRYPINLENLVREYY